MRRHRAHAPRVEDRKMLDEPRLMNLLITNEAIGHIGNADGGAGITHHIVEARGVSHALALDAREGRGGENREAQTESHSEYQARPDHFPHADLQIPMGHRPESKSHQNEADADEALVVVAGA